ncbi:secreted protein [Streptomyces venezuelae]|uniref:FG-GAP repeat domain-containing protein n=1 Tax=Streptomyces gardneri TaxID=66892 RepID=UPI0006BD6C81|nr:VCBS repeat-containing protein [Streptomyces gardneri]ALO10279.1 secreted protein [Streptomyces venezuelae]QPK47298.1 VCBS repeat-containing protein [Streptomyces gardneri]WRK38722.1 VCBS repeat-containing protein [Streptomyces venezuelae]CUM39261.1 N-acetylmuramoyl-L-alanine amidase [Streptomyces venezuelae]
MTRSRTSSRRHLAAAVTAVLALTAGTALVTTPALAAPVPGPAVGQTAEAIGTIPQDARVTSAGTTGFLSTVQHYDTYTTDYLWTKYADGSTTLLNRPNTGFFGQGSDIVWGHQSGSLSFSMYDMAHPSNVVGGVSMNNGTYVRGAIGSALVTTTEDRNTGAVSVAILRKGSSGAPASTPVTGIPGNANLTKVVLTTPGTAVIAYETGRDSTLRYHLAAVDTVTGEVLETRRESSLELADVSLSPTHWSWIEYYYVPDGPLGLGKRAARLHTAPRGGDEAAPTDLGIVGGGKTMHTGLLGDWVTYTRTGGFQSTATSPYYPLTARPLGGGTPVKLLDHVVSAVSDADGSLVVRGGSLTEGEGVYKVTANETGGAPIVTKVATTNTPTALGIVSQDAAPTVVDLDKSQGAKFSWTLTQPNVDGSFTLRHTRTGKTEKIFISTTDGTANPGNKATVDWSGKLVASSVDAYNGDYTWELRVKPRSGIGPELKKTGALKVVRKAAAHDFSDNGTPDILARDSAGRVWRDDITSRTPSDGVPTSSHTLLGAGWGTYSHIEAAGNVAGGSAGDVVAKDKDGNLWLYLGKGDGTFAPRTKIGPGWNAYNKITGGSDVNNDGWSDLFATDTSGVLWLYKGTGNWRTPYGGRTRVGGGWGVMNQITATGNLGGTVHGDLVARDTTGVLWLYPSTGTGTFGARVRIGGGWGGYTQLVGTGDIDGDGRADLFAYSPAGGSYVHSGTGNLSAPFAAPRMPLRVYPAGSTSYNLIG